MLIDREAWGRALSDAERGWAAQRPSLGCPLPGPSLSFLCWVGCGALRVRRRPHAATRLPNGRRPAQAGPHTPPHAFPAQRLNPDRNISTPGLNRSRLKAQFSPHRGAWRTRGRPQESEMRVGGGSGAQGKSPATREPLPPLCKAGFSAASHGHGIQARCGRGSAWILRFGVWTLTSGRPNGASSRQRRGRRPSPVQAPPGCSAPLSRGARSFPPRQGFKNSPGEIQATGTFFSMCKNVLLLVRNTTAASPSTQGPLPAHPQPSPPLGPGAGTVSRIRFWGAQVPPVAGPRLTPRA